MYRYEQATAAARLTLFLLAVTALAPDAARAQAPADFVPVTDAMLQDPAPEDWPMWRRTLDGWGYSPLDQIDRDTSATSGWSGRAASRKAATRERRWSTAG